MAGNKNNTQFTKVNVKEINIKYNSLYGDPTEFKGTIKQAIKHLIELL